MLASIPTQIRGSFALLLALSLGAVLPAAQPLGWEQGPEGCGQHFAQSAVWDAQDHGFLVFGGESILGSGSLAICHDLWLYVPASRSWTALSTTTTPEARAYHACAWDAHRGVMWMFGGIGVTLAARNDLWRYEAKTQQWSQVTVAGPVPPARLSPCLQYSSRLDRLVLYGGSKGFQLNCAMNDVWTFDPGASTWSQQDGTGPGLWQCASAWDDATGTLLVQGGYDGACRATSKTWSCDLASGTWSDLGDGPQSLVANAAVWDDQARRMLMYGGARESGNQGSAVSYSLNHGRWQPLALDSAPGARAYFSMARDPDDGSVFIIGGIRNTFGSPMVSGAPWIWHPGH